MENNDFVLRKIESILQGLQKESNVILERLQKVNELVVLLEKKSEQNQQLEQENEDQVNSRVEYLENRYESIEKQYADDLASVGSEISSLKSHYSLLEPVLLSFSKSNTSLVDQLKHQVEQLSKRISAIELKLANSQITNEAIILTTEISQVNSNKQNSTHAIKQDKSTSTCDIFLNQYYSSSSFDSQNQEPQSSVSNVSNKDQDMIGSQPTMDNVTRRQLLLAQRLNRPDLFLDIISSSTAVINERANEMDDTLKRVENTVTEARDRIINNEKCTNEMQNDIKALGEKLDKTTECVRSILQRGSIDSQLKKPSRGIIQGQPRKNSIYAVSLKKSQKRSLSAQPNSEDELTSEIKPYNKVKPRPRPHRCNF